MGEKRGYLIYECDHGWCIVRTLAPHLRDSSGVWAFSRITQALWWLGRRERLEKPDDTP